MASQPRVLSRRELAALTREAAVPSRSGPRQVWRGQSVAIGLTPQRMAAILLATYDTDYQHYDLLTLAEEMEERDAHYAATLHVRKNALTKLEPAVEAASDGALDVDLADVVRRLTRKPEFSAMVFDLLDAIGKGYAAIEIIWDRSGPVWQPARYEWRDPRFFAFDRVDPQKLLLLDEYGNYNNGVELEPFKWIVHKPRLKSGIPIRAGLARLVALSYMAKSYAISDWLAFSEVFGMPLRLGRYGEGASEEDINELIRAVACLGTDAAATIPDTMSIEFIEPSRGGGGRGGRGGEQLFERLAMYLDKQVSKAVLGQTMTTDDGSSKVQAQVHNQVRLDILKSDARQLENTINRDLVKPFIDLNFGPQKDYPRVSIPVRKPVDIKAFADTLAKLVPLGLGVQASVARDRLGLPEPENVGDLSTLLEAPAKPALAPLRVEPDDDEGSGAEPGAGRAGPAIAGRGAAGRSGGGEPAAAGRRVEGAFQAMTISQKALRAEVERRRGLTLGEAARAVGMPLRTLYRARRVLWVCDPDLERLMDFRLLTIEQAARLALLPEEERRAVLALPARARRREARRLLKVPLAKPARALRLDDATRQRNERWQARLAGVSRGLFRKSG